MQPQHLLMVGMIFVPTVLSAESIHDAVDRGNLEQVSAILVENPNAIRSLDDKRQTPLHRAVWLNQVAMVSYLVVQGADLNLKAYNRFTPLHLARSAEVASVLLQGGADLFLTDTLGDTPLQNAAREHRRVVVDAILATGHPLDLRTAIMLGNTDAARKLVENNPNIALSHTADSGFSFFKSPLILAAEKGNFELVEILLDSGAEVNATQNIFNTGAVSPICYAVWGGHVEIVQLLCERGADCNRGGRSSSGSLLHYALDKSDPRVVELLLQHGASVHGQRSGDSGTEVLHAGARAQDARKIQLLLRYAGEAFDEVARVVALSAAARSGNRDVVRVLRDDGVPMDVVSALALGDSDEVRRQVIEKPAVARHVDPATGRSILSWAVFYRRPNLVHFLLEQGADANGAADPDSRLGYAHSTPVGPNQWDRTTRGETALHVAASQGELEIANRLIAAGAKLDVVDADDATPLHLALQKNHGELVMLLLDSGADITARGRSGNTPLHYSARNPELARLLIERGADVEATSDHGSRPLDWAIRSPETGVAALLIQAGSKPSLQAACILGMTDWVREAVEDDGTWLETRFTEYPRLTPLETAARHGHADLANLLLEFGAQVEGLDPYQTTPLHGAAGAGHVDMVKLLLSRGAAADSNTYSGTPLHRAARGGHLSLVKLLIERGAVITSESTRYGVTPLHSAVSSADGADVVRLLIGLGADVNHRGRLGAQTPLHSAASRGNAEVVQILLDHGADPTITDDRGKTPLDFARLEIPFADVQQAKDRVVAVLEASAWKANRPITTGP